MKKLVLLRHGESVWNKENRFTGWHLDTVSDADIGALNIPTGAPLVYELDEQLRPTTRCYLGDPAAVEAKARAVAEQGKAAA